MGAAEMPVARFKIEHTGVVLWMRSSKRLETYLDSKGVGYRRERRDLRIFAREEGEEQMSTVVRALAGLVAGIREATGATATATASLGILFRVDRLSLSFVLPARQSRRLAEAGIDLAISIYSTSD